jgi:hypothetical protein
MVSIARAHLRHDKLQPSSTIILVPLFALVLRHLSPCGILQELGVHF